MAFLSNKSVNYLNLHLALINLLDQAYNIFLPIYLYTHGFSIPEVLVVLALINALRAPLRLFTFPVLRKWGLKITVMIGAAGFSLSFLILGKVTGWDGWLALYIPFCAFFSAMHWFAFHTLYTLAGEHEKRGRQVATAYAIAAVFSALAPILGAVAITQAGFGYYFLAAPVLAIFMLFTLGRCENIALPEIRWSDGKKVIFGMGTKIHLLESSTYYPLNVCWLFAVYLYVGKIMSLGGIIAFGVMVQVIYQLLLGAMVDKGRGTLIVNAAGSLRILAALGRAFLPLSIPGILGLEAIAGAGSVHHIATLPTVIYNAGKQSPHPMWYWLFAEMGWDAGTAIGAGGAAFLLWQGVELRHVILMALPFITVLWWLLHGYFAKHAYVPTVA